MTEQTHAGTARGRFFHAVQKELAGFERRETEFSKCCERSGLQNCSYPVSVTTTRNSAVPATQELADDA
jgi:hypothetical protein